MKGRCPVCRKIMDEASQQSSREGGFYPFCSNRCRMLDLGKWFDGDYRIPVEVRPEEVEDPPLARSRRRLCRRRTSAKKRQKERAPRHSGIRPKTIDKPE